MGGGNQVGVVGQPQVVVGTEVQYLLAAHRNLGLLGEVMMRSCLYSPSALTCSSCSVR